MLGIEELLTELGGDEAYDRGLPPGFRFHPTDEELITFYLATKVFHGGYTLCGVPIAELDLNRCEPWELPELGKMGEREWFFFSLRDRKYPTGLRTNRATSAGYWKATGKDREVHSVTTGALVGMKKTLVFYRGRAPRGEKTKWVMHEYRLEGDLSDSCRRTCKEEWVICRIYDKRADNKMGISISQSHQPEVCSASATARAAAVANSFPQLPATLPLECQARNPVPALQFRDPFPNNYDLKSLLINQPVPETSLPFLMHLPKTFLQDQHGDDPIFKEQAVVPGSSAIPTHSKAEVDFPDVYYCHDQNLFFPCEMDGSLLDLAVAAAHNTSNAASKYHMSRSSHAFNMNMMLDPSRHH